jgi:magnesium transporter
MKLNCYRITQDGYLEEMSSEASVDLWKQGEGPYWIDITAYQPKELEEWLRDLNVCDLAIQFCVEPRSIGRVIPLNDATIFDFPIHSVSSGTEQDHSVSFLCLQNLIVTMHIGPYANADRLIRALASQLRLSKASTAALVCLLLASESARVAQMVDELRAVVFKLDERMDHDPDSVDADEIREQRRKLRAFDTVTNGQTACFELLKAFDMPFFDIVDLATHFQFAAANASAASKAVSRLDKTITDLGQRFDMNQQEKTNHRLGVLTILSAIFMPLTLLAGIYGMNFGGMPELQTSWGYPAILVVMLLIAGGMYSYFKIRGWLD